MIIDKKYIKKIKLVILSQKGGDIKKSFDNVTNFSFFYSFEILDEYTTYEGQAWGYCFKPGDCNCSQKVQVIKDYMKDC